MTADVLYIGCNGHVCAIRVETGTELWRTPLAVGVELAEVLLGDGLFSATSYQDVCVLEHEGQILAGCNGHLFCLDSGTGHVLWHNELRGLGHNDVTLAMRGKSVQYVASHTTSQSS